MCLSGHDNKRIYKEIILSDDDSSDDDIDNNVDYAGEDASVGLMITQRTAHLIWTSYGGGF